MKKVLLFFIIFIPYTCFISEIKGQVTTDTLWSVPELDGRISYRPGSGIFNLSTTSGSFGPGDGYDLILQEEVFGRGYICFNLDSLTMSDTLYIIQASIVIYQFESIGNDQLGVYPIWDVAGGDTHFCVLDYVDYGNFLDLGDWMAGDPGDPQTLKTNIGIISSDTITGYHTMDVTEYVKADIDSGRTYNQYRMRFTIDTDQDNLGDNLIFIAGDSPLYKPFLIINYGISYIFDKKNVNPISFKLMQNFPNPFNPVTSIYYTLQKTGTVELIVFSLLGEKIKTLVNTNQTAGGYEVQFNGFGLPSGIYLYQLTFNNKTQTKKMILIR